MISFWKLNILDLKVWSLNTRLSEGGIPQCSTQSLSKLQQVVGCLVVPVPQFVKKMGLDICSFKIWITYVTIKISCKISTRKELSSCWQNLSTWSLKDPLEDTNSKQNLSSSYLRRATRPSQHETHVTSSVSFGAKFSHLALEKRYESFKAFIFLLRKWVKGHQPYIHGKMFLKSPDLD